MSNHVCTECNRVFARKENLDNHVKKQACKKLVHFCKFCNKGYTTETSMYRHMRSACKVKKTNDDEKDKIYERLLQVETRCKLVEQENKELQEKIKKINKTSVDLSKTTNTVIKGSNNNINTGIINNNTNNIILVGYGKEDLTKLDKSDIMKALQNGYYSTVKLTEAVHFNPKYLEYHNVYISNIKDKYAMMFDGKRWTLTTKEELINQIYEDKKNYIEENFEDFINSLSQSRKRALERWLDTDDEDKKIKEIKDSIKLLLYNSRQLPLKFTGEDDFKIVKHAKISSSMKPAIVDDVKVVKRKSS